MASLFGSFCVKPTYYFRFFRHFSGRSGRSLLQSEPLSTWECENVTDIPSHVRNEYPLSPFCKKYLHAYGIPVISSENATDAALQRACYVVVFLLADRKDIRHSVYKRRGRAGVIAVTEGVTSIPEHSWLEDWWNWRSRGLGGTIWVPISTCEYSYVGMFRRFMIRRQFLNIFKVAKIKYSLTSKRKVTQYLPSRGEAR